MSWDRDGNLYCNCCYKIVISKKEVTEKDIKENIGKTFCYECQKKYGCKFEAFVKEYYKKKRENNLRRPHGS